MSKKDKNENAIIDSEVEESIEVQEKLEPASTSSEPIKKRSFFSFLTFILSLIALSLSAYVYYLHTYGAPVNDVISENKKIESSILSLEKHTNNQLKNINQLIKKLQLSNQQLKDQLAKNKEELLRTKVSESINQPLEVTSYDDSSLIQQITLLETKLNQQKALLEQLQTNLDASNVKNNQSLQLLSVDLKSLAVKKSSDNLVVSNNSQVKSLAESLLQEAYIQLNINGNIVKSQILISKTRAQLSLLTGMRYGYLATELEKFSEKLDTLEQPNIDAIKEQINNLSESSNQLSFVNSEPADTDKKESSWYENLISVKKIDRTKQLKLSKNDQFTIKNIVNNHYQILKMALISKNQNLWQSEISQIQNLLQTHFEQASDISAELVELSLINVDQKLPDLDLYLKQFRSINLANENE